MITRTSFLPTLLLAVVSTTPLQANLYRPLKTLCSNPAFRQSLLSHPTSSVKRKFFSDFYDSKGEMFTYAIAGGMLGGGVGTILGGICLPFASALCAFFPPKLAKVNLSNQKAEEYMLYTAYTGAAAGGVVGSFLGGGPAGVTLWSAILVSAYVAGKFKGETKKQPLSKDY